MKQNHEEHGCKEKAREGRGINTAAEDLYIARISHRSLFMNGAVR
jgi:hypothetical protein